MPNNQRLLELALLGLEAERRRITEEITEVRSQLGQPNGRIASPVTGGRRPMSTAAKRKISEGMKRRYAAMRAAVEGTKVKRRQGGLTAAGRKKLSDMMKARWAARRNAAAKR